MRNDTHPYAILVDDEVRPATLDEYAKWDRDNKRIARQTVRESPLVWLTGRKRKAYDVSTVFLGLDHGYGDGPSLWFETMIFDRGAGDDYWRDIYCDRYTTAQEARDGHVYACKLARQGALKSHEAYYGD